jgi:hypothetical protein
VSFGHVTRLVALVRLLARASTCRRVFSSGTSFVVVGHAATARGAAVAATIRVIRRDGLVQITADWVRHTLPTGGEWSRRGMSGVVLMVGTGLAWGLEWYGWEAGEV